MPYTRMVQPVAEGAGTKQLIVDALHERVVDDATGRSDLPYKRHLGEHPESRFWLGSLAPEAEVKTPDGSRRTNEPRPASQGFSFRVAELPVCLDVRLDFALWVALHPTYQEQIVFSQLTEEREDQEGARDQQGTIASDNPALELAKVRMKIPVQNIAIRVTIDNEDADLVEPRHVGRAEIGEAIEKTFRALPMDTVLHRPLRRPGGLRPRHSDIRDERAWRMWERANLTDQARPQWVAEVDTDVRSLGDGSYEVLVTTVNRSPARHHQFSDRDGTRTFTSGTCHPALYEARMHVHPEGKVLPYELEQIPDSYRYDRKVPALGWNSAVIESQGGFTTHFTAVARTERVWPRAVETDGLSLLDTRFSSMVADPLPAIRHLVSEAERWTALAWSADELERLATQHGWNNATRGEAAEDAERCRQEVEWVRSGVRLLESDDSLLRAFRLMNETMARSAKGRFDRWRPFQLAFILGCLPSIVNHDGEDTVDILWFPTGGGKTEAYFGLNALLLFHGRLKGRTGGSQTWARFPMRLLSLQQTQRFAESVLHAETVRREQKDIRRGEPFGVGYLVGAGNTPNKILLPDDRYYKGWDPFAEKKAESCRVLEACPLCSQRPRVAFNEDSYTMEHRCETPSCVLSGRLPVYVIDDDIERWAPSVIVGTVDKLTKLSWSNGFRHLLGRAYGRCDRHGLSNQLGRCGVWSCRLPLQPVGRGFGGLQLEIQDEMHLLSESLGALDGNYETLFHAIAAACGIERIKVIGATATIEGYKEQSDHLYRRKPKRFPVHGPTRHESFWAFENRGDPLRTYVSILPRGVTMLDAAVRITRSHRLFLQEALEDVGLFCQKLGVDPGRAVKVKEYLRELYDVLTTYALRKDELARYRRDVLANPLICPDAAWDSITGDVGFWDVRNVLRRLEKPEEDQHRLRILGATSAISHGVDIDRLNVMCLIGMPNQTSEFIQATSRVGRTHPGLVFCLVNANRVRDVSHFRYFNKWAEYLDRLVEPVPVNRESLRVLDVVLPGGFMAWLLQIEEPRWRAGDKRRRRLWGASELARAIEAKFLDESSMVNRLLDSFAIDLHNPRFERHRKQVQEFVHKVFLEISLNSQEESVVDVLEACGVPVPRSLRDTDTQIWIRGEV